MIKEKQAAGIEIAKRKGVYKGRRKKYNEHHKGIQHALHLRKTTNMSVNDICEITRISRATFYRSMKDMNR